MDERYYEQQCHIYGCDFSTDDSCNYCGRNQNNQED